MTFLGFLYSAINFFLKFLSIVVVDLQDLDLDQHKNFNENVH